MPLQLLLHHGVDYPRLVLGLHSSHFMVDLDTNFLRHPELVKYLVYQETYYV